MFEKTKVCPGVGSYIGGELQPSTAEIYRDKIAPDWREGQENCHEHGV